MRLKVLIPIVAVVAFGGGAYSGYLLAVRAYLPVYETPIIFMHSLLLSTMDSCLERDDRECFNIAFGALVRGEAERARAVLEHGLLTIDEEAEVSEEFSKLDELRAKYDPDA
jgi:hypothetical protein